PAPAPAEEAAEDVAEVAEAVGGEGEAAGTAARAAEAHGAEPADLVVLLALLLVADDVVGGRDLLEPLLGGGVTRVGVGVVLARELPVGALDLLGRRRLGDAEDLVVVLLEPLALGLHGAPVPPGATP